MWGIQTAQVFLWPEIGHYGILPRTFSGLIGIFFAPWIHHGWWHLISNSIPFLILGALVQFKDTTIFWEATLIISILAGLGIWLFGSTGYHAGASALILGYWSFLLADAYNTKSIKAVIIATIVLIFYSGFFFVLLDLRTHISWIGHTSGLVAGVIVAKLYFDSEHRRLES
jgi:membrane associated rhomboid family serine protease